MERRIRGPAHRGGRRRALLRQKTGGATRWSWPRRAARTQGGAAAGGASQTGAASAAT